MGCLGNIYNKGQFTEKTGQNLISALSPLGTRIKRNIKTNGKNFTFTILFPLN